MIFQETREGCFFFLKGLQFDMGIKSCRVLIGFFPLHSNGGK